MTAQKHYFDYAAATPLDERVLAAMQPYFTALFFNPSSPYEPARQVRRDIESARQRIARLIGAKPDEVVFTAGATESVNILFRSLLTDANAHSVTVATEHAAVLGAARLSSHTIVAVDQKGQFATTEILAAIRPDTRLVSISIVNNELGNLHPIKDIARQLNRIKDERRGQGDSTPLVFHVDASQAVGMMDIHTARLGVDAMTLNASKAYGPKQTGVLWVKSSILLKPFIVGGGQESGIRSGTENVPSIIGAAHAFELAEKLRKPEMTRLSELRRDFEKKLLEIFPGVVIQGAKKHRLPNIMTISFPGVDAERVLFALEARGILVATGAACAANKDTASHVLKALNISSDEVAGSMRISFGRQTTQADIDVLITALKECVAQEVKYGL